MIQVPYHKVSKWAVKKFKVVCMIYYSDGYISAVMSKQGGC